MNATQVLIFKTSIKTASDKKCIQELLDAHSAIEKWSIDTEDADCVMRIVTATMNPEEIIELASQKGFYCSELE